MKNLFAFAWTFIICSAAHAQDFKETVQPLSKKSINGHLYSFKRDDDGVIRVTYKMKLDKKSDEVAYEETSFDSDLKLLETKDTQVKKVEKPDYERTAYYASVGGSTSYDVLSMKLRLRKVVTLQSWNHDKQRYVIKKTILNEAVKPKNDNGKNYLGLASFNSFKEEINDVCIVAKTEGEGKNATDSYYILHFNDQMEIHETPIALSGKHTLIYSDQLSNDNVVLVFAPGKGEADLSKYVYLEFNMSGNLVNKVEFKSPSTAMVITSMSEKDGSVYFCGSSAKSKGAYEEEFGEYATIPSPGFSGAENNMDMKWEQAASRPMTNFHLIKISGKSLAYATSIPVKEFKSKMKTAPGDKGYSAYEGNKFYIERFAVLPNNELLVAGQLWSRAIFNGNSVKTYKDIVCFHFSADGNLKAQYAVGKMNNDKNSEIFPMIQDFYVSEDGNSAYWELYEIKGENGYADFSDAINGIKTFYPLYFPRITKIDLANQSLGKIHVMGDGNYYLRKNQPKIYDAKEKSVFYIGSDEKYKTIWLGKMKME